jgi:FtsP/CotA-like multicopper oxidase with cupredoxin domain
MAGGKSMRTATIGAPFSIAFVPIAGLLAMLASAPVGPVSAQTTTSHSYDLAIAKGRLVSGLRTIRVRRGDSVELRWSADRPSIIHLHGYDIEVKVEPGIAASMRFQAYATGRFPIETHAPTGRHVSLLHLEVHPR